MKYSVDQLIAKYIELRTKKAEVVAEAKKTTDELDEKMSYLETALKVLADEQGVTSFKTKAGTMYLTTVDRASVTDWNAVLKFIVDNNKYDLLNRAVNKTAVREYVEANEAPPPGVSFTRSLGVNIRKPSLSTDLIGE